MIHVPIYKIKKGNIHHNHALIFNQLLSLNIVIYVNMKMQSHFKAIQNILKTLKQLKIIGHKIINAIMNDMVMNHSLHIGTCICRMH